MASLFSKPKIPKPIPPEPAPAPLSVNDDLISQQTQDRLRRRKGRASTLLSGGGEPNVGLKQALGS